MCASRRGFPGAVAERRAAASGNTRSAGVKCDAPSGPSTTPSPPLASVRHLQWPRKAPRSHRDIRGGRRHSLMAVLLFWLPVPHRDGGQGVNTPHRAGLGLVPPPIHLSLVPAIRSGWPVHPGFLPRGNEALFRELLDKRLRLHLETAGAVGVRSASSGRCIRLGMGRQSGRRARIRRARAR